MEKRLGRDLEILETLGGSERRRERKKYPPKHCIAILVSA
jgi:hypothetical protein